MWGREDHLHFGSPGVDVGSLEWVNPGAAESFGKLGWEEMGGCDALRYVLAVAASQSLTKPMAPLGR